MANFAALTYIIHWSGICNNMDETTINRTKSAIDALIEIQQLWIDYVPQYDLSDQDLVKLKKRLKRAIDNVQKIYDDNEDKMLQAEERLKAARGKKWTKISSSTLCITSGFYDF